MQYIDTNEANIPKSEGTVGDQKFLVDSISQLGGQFPEAAYQFAVIRRLRLRIDLHGGGVRDGIRRGRRDFGISREYWERFSVEEVASVVLFIRSV